jgi:mRNA interferase RelE/StbE
MAKYKVVWKRSAHKELEKLPGTMILKIVRAVEQLGDDPHPEGSKKIIGSDQAFRIRIGSYRVIHDVFENILTVQIVRVRHRKDAYRK